MNENEFYYLVSRTKMKERSIRLSYSVLVEGNTLTKVARNEVLAGRECSVQCVWRAVKRVSRELLISQSSPQEYECIVKPIPKVLVDDVMAYIQTRIDEHNKTLLQSLT
ncbi:MAG: hypothetical protein QM500_08800 [Methylococcales bacterium]